MQHDANSKELTRESILTHLNFFQNSGVARILKPSTITNSIEQSTPRLETALPSSNHIETKTAEQIQSDSTNTACTSAIDLSSLHSLTDLQTALTNCQRCKLSKKRTNLVFGVGNPNADLMFVGEGPGADEDLQGEPFVGKAGQLLTKIINAMGFAREDVYIANVVKCRPPENRNPELDEIETCMPFLKKQIELVQPKIIMCLGKFAAQTVLNTQIPITKMRGTFQALNNILVMPAFHPAYLLRNPEMKRIMWEDCKTVMEKLTEMGIKPT